MDLDLKKSIFNLRGRLMHFNAIKESDDRETIEKKIKKLMGIVSRYYEDQLSKADLMIRPYKKIKYDEYKRQVEIAIRQKFLETNFLSDLRKKRNS